MTKHQSYLIKKIPLSAFYFQFIQNSTHLFKCCDTSRYKRKTQFIVYHTHHAKHRFHTCRVTVYKQQLEQFSKLVMNSQSTLVVASQSQTSHTAEFARKSVSYNGTNRFIPSKQVVSYKRNNLFRRDVTKCSVL